ncbi:MAG: glycosyltransferase family 4 protein [Chitinivorax sp.]
MKILYLYNEVLPTRKAHDAYIWRNCISLAQAGADVTLACGKGSKAATTLASYYKTELPPNFKQMPLRIFRRNFGLPWTWNRVFDSAAQRLLTRTSPDIVILSVRKQGQFHLAKKLPDTRYVYEVHELEWYPTQGESQAASQKVQQEREMLAQADLVTVTTEALRNILLKPPYRLTNPVAIVPLAIQRQAPLQPIEFSLPLHVMYIGQLYDGQGVEDLADAVAEVPSATLTIVGGSDQDVQRIQARLPPQSAERIRFTGFVEPGRLPGLAQTAHILAAPFRAQKRMPFVAHTKLCEYIAWRRPVLAPDLPIVHEHFPNGAGLCSYQPNNIADLIMCLQRISRQEAWQAAMDGIAAAPSSFWADRASAYLKLLQGL